jgi:hypothetical protein
MKVFVIFGNIDFVDGDAHVHTTEHAGFYDEVNIHRNAKDMDMNYLVPHHFAGRIIFTKYQKEIWSE